MRPLGAIGVALALGGCASSSPPLPSVNRARSLVEQPERRAGQLRLSCIPADAEVAVDGVAQGFCSEVGQQGGGLSLGPGDQVYRVEVKKQGFWPYVTYYAPSGARAALTVTLVRVGEPEGGAP